MRQLIGVALAAAAVVVVVVANIVKALLAASVPDAGVQLAVPLFCLLLALSTSK